MECNNGFTINKGVTTIVSKETGEAILLKSYVEVALTNGYEVIGFLTQISEKCITVESYIEYTSCGIETSKNVILLPHIQEISAIEPESGMTINPNWKQYFQLMGDTKLYTQNGRQLNEDEEIKVKAVKNILKKKHRSSTPIDKIIDYVEKYGFWDKKPWEIANDYWNDIVCS